MPKMKTHSGAKKRFKRTANGKIKYQKSYKRHLLTRRSQKRKRQLRNPGYVDKSQIHVFAKLMPYGG